MVQGKKRVRSRRGGSRDRATNVHGGGQCDIVRRSRRRRRATGREEKALCERGTREEEEVGQDAGAQEEGAEPRRFLFFFIGGTVPFLSFLFFFTRGSNRAFSSEISFLVMEISYRRASLVELLPREWTGQGVVMVVVVVRDSNRVAYTYRYLSIIPRTFLSNNR